jgi:hypothetical protein
MSLDDTGNNFTKWHEVSSFHSPASPQACSNQFASKQWRDSHTYISPCFILFPSPPLTLLCVSVSLCHSISLSALPSPLSFADIRTCITEIVSFLGDDEFSQAQIRAAAIQADLDVDDAIDLLVSGELDDVQDDNVGDVVHSNTDTASIADASPIDIHTPHKTDNAANIVSHQTTSAPPAISDLFNFAAIAGRNGSQAIDTDSDAESETNHVFASSMARMLHGFGDKASSMNCCERPGSVYVLPSPRKSPTDDIQA